MKPDSLFGLGAGEMVLMLMLLLPILFVLGLLYYLRKKAKKQRAMLSALESRLGNVPAEQMPPMREIKSPGVAVLLSLLIAGAGQIYNGEIGKGLVLMVLQLISVALTPFVYLPAVFVLILAVYSAVNANDVAFKINYEARKREIASILEAQHREETERTTIRADAVADALVKAHRLFQHQMLSAQEFTSRKTALIRDLKGKTLATGAEDFLLAMIPLVESGVLTEPELAQAKSILMGC